MPIPQKPRHGPTARTQPRRQGPTARTQPRRPLNDGLGRAGHDPRLARSWSYRRPSSRVARRRQAVAAVGIVALAAALIVIATTGGGGRSTPAASSKSPPPPASKAIPAIEAGVLPWSLPAPLSREVVLPGSGNTVTLVGGIGASGGSLSGIFSLDTTTGTTAVLGRLATGIHDAAGAQAGSRDFVLGGGSPATVANVEAFGAPSVTPGVAASVIGSLPAPRSDSSAVTIAGKVYVVGGYDGTNPDREVLETADGQHFSVVAELPVPVRYAAVATLDAKIYLFGGQAVSGPRSGSPVDAVQMVDPANKTAKVVGHLPVATAGAAAALIGGKLYFAGGTTATAGAESSPSATSSSASTNVTGNIYAFDSATNRVLSAGTLPVPVAYSAVQVVGTRAWLFGGESNGTVLSSVEMLKPNKGFGTSGAPGAGSPFFGSKLLIADRGNDRLLLLDDRNQIVWGYPSAYAAAPPGGFYFPDDAFFAKHGTEIISNQEENETIVIIGFPSGQLLWQYGHPRQPGTALGYLHQPDDAFLLENGQVTIADASACRVLFINPDKTIASQIGTDNVCKHQPPTFVGSPNGDTPLANGNVLVSEINGQWVSEYTPSGQLVWTVHLPIHYPSDPQQLGPDLYLISDYSTPGQILEFNREGQILYRYAPATGLGALDRPSLTELLPSGVFMSNDDYRNRMVAVDPDTQALVWQYGMPDKPGTAPGMLNTPDGFDLLLPDGSTPTHSPTA